MKKRINFLKNRLEDHRIRNIDQHSREGKYLNQLYESFLLVSSTGRLRLL